MTLLDFRPSKPDAPQGSAHDHADAYAGGGYLEYDDLLASGDELRLEEDSSGHLVLIEGSETE